MIYRTDVVLLANVYEVFRDTSLQHYKLDPVHFYTSPGLAWKACLKCTGIRLELLTDPDMLLMFECGIRGGITQAVCKYTAASNPYMDPPLTEHSMPSGPGRCMTPWGSYTTPSRILLIYNIWAQTIYMDE